MPRIYFYLLWAAGRPLGVAPTDTGEKVVSRQRREERKVSRIKVMNMLHGQADAATLRLTKCQQLETIFAQQFAFEPNIVADPNPLKAIPGFRT